MSDRAAMIVMVKMIKAKIEEQKLCLEMVDDPKTKELWVTFQGSSKKYWYPRVPEEKVREMMAAPSKGEYFMNNIHDQYSVNYQLHGTHAHQGYLGSNRKIKKYYKNMREPYAEGMRKGSMEGVLNNGRS